MMQAALCDGGAAALPCRSANARHLALANARLRPNRRQQRAFLCHPASLQRRASGIAAATTSGKAGSGGEKDLEVLHEQLLQQIEERKKLQKTLAEKHGGKSSAGQDPEAAAPKAVSQPRSAPQPQAAAPTAAASPPPAPVPPPPQPQQSAPQQQQQPSQPQVEVVPEPPLAGDNVMNVVFVGAECAPWSKTGGLGDVMGALPKAMARRGHRVMVVAPRYANYEEGWDTSVRIQINAGGSLVEVGYFHGYLDGVDYVFVDHPAYHHVAHDLYAGSGPEIQFRCALLCKAALEAVWCVPCGGVPYGDSVVFVANDWHTALLPVYLQAHYRDYDKMTYARAVSVIHNIAHQGRAPMVEIGTLEIPDSYTHLFYLDDPVGGVHMNVFKAGLILAHRIVAVSHGYAWECQTQDGGWGLDHILREHSWKLRGIVNGIDTTDWSPHCDRFLTSDGYRQYDMSTLQEGKAACKAALQRELGLPEDPNIPLLGFIGRLDYQKGVDIIRDSFDWLMSSGVQLVLLGSGREDLENSLREMEHSRGDQCRAWVGFNVSIAHRITAGCDILLMPSRFEPCGLNQLYAMAYGTVPVVHAVGGLRDTVSPFNPHENTGLGWTFDHVDGGAFRTAVHDALFTYREYRDSFRSIQLRGMDQDLTWDKAAQQYEEVLVAAKYQW